MEWSLPDCTKRRTKCGVSIKPSRPAERTSCEFISLYNPFDLKIRTGFTAREIEYLTRSVEEGGLGGRITNTYRERFMESRILNIWNQLLKIYSSLGSKYQMMREGVIELVFELHNATEKDEVIWIEELFQSLYSRLQCNLNDLNALHQMAFNRVSLFGRRCPNSTTCYGEMRRA